MARAGLGLGVRDLAALAEVAPGTITRLERGESIYPRTLETIRAALEAAGIVFVPAGPYQGEGGPGIRFNAPPDE
nr:helix-turn-helix transcriptional regulator [Azospirillum agricola]